MKTPEKLSSEVSEILFERLSDEYTAQMFYRAAANWCANAGFYKAQAFFDAEAVAEAEHAKGIQDYLTDWNVTPKISAIKAPQTEFKDLIALIGAAYQIEHDLYNEYEDSSVKVLKAGEVCTFDFLQGYRKIQNDSVVEYSDMLASLSGVDSDKATLLLLEEELFG